MATSELLTIIGIGLTIIGGLATAAYFLWRIAYNTGDISREIKTIRESLSELREGQAVMDRRLNDHETRLTVIEDREGVRL